MNKDTAMMATLLTIVALFVVGLVKGLVYLNEHEPPPKQVSLTLEQWMVLHESGYITGALANARDEDGSFYKQKRVDSLEMVAVFHRLQE